MLILPSAAKSTAPAISPLAEPDWLNTGAILPLAKPMVPNWGGIPPQGGIS